MNIINSFCPDLFSQAPSLAHEISDKISTKEEEKNAPYGAKRLNNNYIHAASPQLTKYENHMKILLENKKEVFQ